MATAILPRRYTLRVLWLILGSAGAAFSGMLFFMITAFGGGGLVAPGKPPLPKSLERYLVLSLFAGPFACALPGILPWLDGRLAWFAVPPALLVLQFVLIAACFGRR